MKDEGGIIGITTPRFSYSAADLGGQVASSFPLEIRRLRLFLRGRLFDGHIEALLHLNTAPGSIELIDVYANAAFSDHLQLRVGQLRIPYTQHRQLAFGALTFMEWTPLARALGAERQLGVLLHNGAEPRPAFGYALGVFTGQSARRAFAIGVPMLYGEALSNPSDLSQPQRPAEPHPEVALRRGRQGALAGQIASGQRSRTLRSRCGCRTWPRV